ncbi:MAG: thiamine phosphate synthase [Lentisphaeraceae bacterium]|nr:thiamine phosphate synthase [Lentisphaeraceae bacterium]
MKNLLNSHIYWVYDKSLSDQYDPSLEVLNKLITSGGVDVIQFRAKNLNYSSYCSWVERLKQKVDFQNVLTFSNDHIEAYKDLGLDGVHVGADDTPVDQARQILGNDCLIGATARTLDRALLADRQGADYLGVGTVFTTTTKQGLTAKGPNFIRNVQDQVNIPVYAIGGINSKNASELKGVSIDKVAVASNLLNTANPLEELSSLQKIFS